MDKNEKEKTHRKEEKEEGGEEKSKAGRISKIHPFLIAAKGFFKEHEGELDIWIYTDEELLFQINERLAIQDQITDRTFQNWKAKVKSEDFDEEDPELDPCFAEFFRLIKKALVIQKKMIFQKMLDSGEKTSWTRWAWILERKFTDWNLKNIQSNDPENPLPSAKIGTVNIIEIPDNGRRIKQGDQD